MKNEIPAPPKELYIALILMIYVFYINVCPQAESRDEHVKKIYRTLTCSIKFTLADNAAYQHEIKKIA